MSYIFGYAAGNEQSLQKALEETFRGSDIEERTNSKLVVSGNTALGYVYRGQGKRPLLLETPELYIMIQGRIDNSELRLSGDKAARRQLEVFFDIVRNRPDKLRGDFIIALLDKNDHSIRLLRDQLGVRAVYYYERPDLFAFSTHLEPMKKIPGLVLEIDEQWIADTISTVRSEHFRTPYRNIHKLEPGNLVEYKANRLKKNQYYKLIPGDSNTDTGKDEISEKFFHLLKQAVERRTSNYNIIGSELSGGLDSSSVTAIASILAENHNKNVYTFSHILPDEILGNCYPFEDEREFSEIMVSTFPNLSHTNCGTDPFGLLASIKNNIIVQGGPTQAGFHILSRNLYQEAANLGVEVLLSGFGGDEGVTGGNRGLSNELIMLGEWDAYKEFFLKRLNTGIKGLIRYYLLRFVPFSKQYIMHKSKISFASRENFNMLALDTLFQKKMKIRKRYFIKNVIQHASSMNENTIIRLTYTGLSQRLEFSHLAVSTMNMEYAYPLLDLDLVEFFLNLKWNQKTDSRIGRYLIRSALEGLLPDAIRMRRDKTGTTIPSYLYRIISDHDQILSLINRSEQENRYHYFDYNRLRAWQREIEQYTGNEKGHNALAFLNALQLLLLQEMERTGEYRSGIWC